MLPKWPGRQFAGHNATSQRNQKDGFAGAADP